MRFLRRIMELFRTPCACSDGVNPYCVKHGDHHELMKLLGFNVYVNGERGEPW